MLLLLTAAAVASAPVSVFGIEIGRPLALSECAPNDSYLKFRQSQAEKKASRRLDKPFLVYEMPASAPCFQRYNDQFTTAPLTQELITIRFPLSDRLEIVPMWEIQAFVIAGSVELLTSPTSNYTFQESVLDTIKKKFGNPTTLESVPLQNGFGARFQALRAVWHPSASVTATYESFAGDKQGDFTVGTPAGIAAYKAHNAPPAATLRL